MDRCALCPRVNKLVPPCGAHNKEGIFFCGEAPGSFEDRKGIPFVGKTGQELDQHYLPLAGLRRENVTISNTISCLPVGHGGKLDMGRQKDMDLLTCCASHHLYPELDELKPTLIVPMGAFACCAIDPDIQLDLQHGIPLETSWGTVFPMYHPSGGVHEPKRMLFIRNDFIRLGKYLKGKLRLPKDEHPKPLYMENRCTTYAENYSVPLACDTEVTRYREPFCLTYSTYPGTGFLIRADDKDSLNSFQLMLDNWTGPILFHNYLFDENVVRQMGLRFPRHLIVDTMARSFHLGNLPQGLKSLAYRELGMAMVDFDDVVTPYSTPLCLQYIRDALSRDWPKPDEQLVKDDNGLLKMYKPQSMSTKFKRFLTDYQKNPNKSPYEAWDNWEDSHELIQSVMGPWPGKDIRYAPFDKVLHYACRDADATLRLWQREQGMTRRVRKSLQENWGDI